MWERLFFSFNEIARPGDCLIGLKVQLALFEKVQMTDCSCGFLA
jgi:hypothetical protein